MVLQTVINNIFRQNWKDNAVLGRVLFGTVILIIGLMDIFNIGGYTAAAPAYLPFPSFLVVGAGTLFVISGFFILANIHVRQATMVLVVLLTLLIILVYIPVGHMQRAIETVGFVGTALILYALAKRDLEAQKKAEIEAEMSDSKKENHAT